MNNQIERSGIVLISLAFFAVFMITNASANLAFDNDCPVSASNNVNFSSGTAVSLPFDYNETSMASSNLAVFLGTNTNYFCSQVNDSLSTFAASRTVIFTPEFLNALKTSSCSAAFEDYMENYRKSGNMLSSAGSVFCGVKNLTFDATTSPSGVTFDYPVIGEGVIGVNNVHYNAVQLKKYMLAYLMNNPDAELSGVISTFANAINLNVSLSCPGTSSITDFFNNGKGNYTTYFKPNLQGVDYGSGESLKPSNGVSGVFGWLMNYALGNQVLPIITAANLSTNKIYVCGINSIEEYYSSTITTSDNAVNITLTSEINTSLEIKTGSAIINASIEVFKYTENPKASGALGIVGLGKYIGIKADSALESAISSVIIKVYYTDAEVSAAGVDEGTLRLYYYNTSFGDWVAYDSPNGGVNTTENYVWANTTHFSDWGVFGTAPASASHHGRTVMPAINTTAGCSIQWSCTEWSACINGMQARACNDIGTCSSDPISETRSCIITPVVPITIPTSTPARTESTTAGPTPTGNAVSNLSKVPLRIGLFSIISALVVIGIISWTILMKRNQKIEEDSYRLRRKKRARKRARKAKMIKRAKKRIK
jgi:hypothetical protein